MSKRMTHIDMYRDLRYVVAEERTFIVSYQVYFSRISWKFHVIIQSQSYTTEKISLCRWECPRALDSDLQPDMNVKMK